MQARLFLTSALLFLVTVSFQAQAQTNQKPPKYQVELIVFETLALRGWTEEYWKDDLPLIDMEGSVDLPSLPEQKFMLASEEEKMTPQKGYYILYHKSWILKGLAEDDSHPLKIEVLPEEDYQPKLSGTLKFYKSRYAHVRLNLELERKIPAQVREEFANNQSIDLEMLPEFWRFQLEEARKVKSGELHYFDHPIFGALVKIQYKGR